jgi:hypothetical protein
MKAFDLEKALAGEKVVTHDGQEVTQVVLFKPVKGGCESICALIDGCIRAFYEDGNYNIKGDKSDMDLFMAPKKLSGFINYYVDFAPSYHRTRQLADMEFNTAKARTACIDLSQFEEGHGL